MSLLVASLSQPSALQAGELGLGTGYVVHVEMAQVGGLRGFGVVQEIPAGLTEIISSVQRTDLPDSTRYDSVLAEVEQRLQAEPNDSLLIFKKGVLFYLKGEYDQARSILEALIPRTTDKTIREEAAFHLGLIAYKQRRYEDGVFFFKDCLWYHPGRANAHVNVGIALLQLGNKQEATTHLKKALELNPTSKVALFYLGYLAYETGDAERARYYLKEAKAVEPDNPILAEWSQKLQPPQDPQLPQLLQRYRQEPTNGLLNIEISEAFVRSGEIKRAKFHAEEALKRLPNHWGSYAQLAQVQFYAHHYPESLHLYHRASQLNPNDLDLQRAQATVHVFLGNNQEAKTILQTLLKKDPQNLLGHAILGQVYCLMHKLSEAEEEYRQCLKIGQAHIEVDELAMRINRLQRHEPDAP